MQQTITVNEVRLIATLDHNGVMMGLKFYNGVECFHIYSKWHARIQVALDLGLSVLDFDVNDLGYDDLEVSNA